MLIRDLLNQKGDNVVTVSVGASVREAVGKLVENRIGALVVTGDDGLPQGIMSERDILRLCFESPPRLEGVLVRDIMTKDILVGLPEDDLNYAMNIMTTNRIRHMPIVAGRRLVGIISIGDVVKALLRETQASNRYLEDYISGKYPV